MAEHEAACLAASLSAVLTAGFVPRETAVQLRAWLSSVTELRLSVTATGEELAITSSLLQPQQFTVSVRPIASAGAGACIASGQPSISLCPAPQLCVPISPTPDVRLPGVPRARGCLQVAFASGHASTVFRRAAALARALAATLPQHAAPLVAEVRQLLAGQPAPQLAQQYVIQLQPPGGGDGGGDVAAAAGEQHPCSSIPAGACCWASGISAEQASAEHMSSASDRESTRFLQQIIGDGAAGSSGRHPAAGGEIQPRSRQPGQDPASRRMPPSASLAPADGSPTIQWPQPSAQQQELLQAAAKADEFEVDVCTKQKKVPPRWPGGGKWHCCWDGAPLRQSALALTFADWRLEQLFQPWRAAACSQDDVAAVQVVAPAAVLIGCCRPLQLFTAAPGFALWTGHAALLLVYLAVRLALAHGPAAWLPRWRQHALVVLWAVAAAHATRFAVNAATGGGLLRGATSPIAVFRSSGLETLATCALVLRVQWVTALPLLAGQALLAMQHLPAACEVSPQAGTAATGWLAGFACRRGAAVLVLHWAVMGLLPAAMMRGMDAALRQRFAKQLCGEAAATGGQGQAAAGAAAVTGPATGECSARVGASSRQRSGDMLPSGGVIDEWGSWDQRKVGSPSSRL